MSQSLPRRHRVRSPFHSITFWLIFCLTGIGLCYPWGLPSKEWWATEDSLVSAEDAEQRSTISSSPPKKVSQSNSDLETISNNWELIAPIQKIHPLIIAAAQVLIVLGVCLLLTDNEELELYLKIDFRPPKTDILN